MGGPACRLRAGAVHRQPRLPCRREGPDGPSSSWPALDHLPPRLPGLEAPTRPTRDMDTDLLPRRRGRTGRGAPSLWPLPTNVLRRLSGCRLPGRWIVTAARCRRPEPAARPGAASAGTRARPWPRSNTDAREDRSTATRRGDRRSRPHTEAGVGGSSAPIHLRRMGRATTTAADRHGLSADPADLSRRPRQWLHPRVAPDDLRLNNQTHSMNTQGGPRCFVPR